MTDSLLKNDGGFLLLNSGGQILLNAHEAGVNIQGTHAVQQTIQKRRKTQLIPISFTFQLISNTIPRVVIQLINIGKVLSPRGIYSEELRDSFRLPLTDLKQKLDKLSKYSYIESAVSHFVDEYLEDYIVGKKLFKSIKKGFKIWKK